MPILYVDREAGKLTPVLRRGDTYIHVFKDARGNEQFFLKTKHPWLKHGTLDQLTAFHSVACYDY